MGFVHFRVIRFRIEFTCACGRAISLHQDREQQRCGCGAIYTFASVAEGAQAALRAVRDCA